MTLPLTRLPTPSLLTALIALFFSLPCVLAADQKPNSIDGAWIVVSVELAGQKVEGLAGAELTLAGGKKTFKLPSGTVEQGAYTLDPSANPKRIDSTTEGRSETEAGIYKLESDRLTLCLATRGGARPESFATQNGTDLVLIVLKRARQAAKPQDETAADKPSGPRRFRMGFTGFVYDISLDAVTRTRTFCRENGDIIAHHIEGVPWTESMTGQPFPKTLLEEWEGKKLATPPNGKVYLAISPGRGDLKVADKAGPLPKELKGKTYDDPLVIKTYLNYCRRAIDFFRPDYLAVGIETNEIEGAGPKTWQAYVTLHQHVYRELKKEHPRMPIFASWTLHNMFKKRGTMLESWKKLTPYNDLIGVSYYPFFVPDKDRLAALDWMIEEFAGSGKPFAMVETNDAAERLPLPQARVVIEGTPAKQSAYYRRLLSLAQKHEFLFVISFIHQDYDDLWDKIKSTSPELFKAWRDCGLLDQTGAPRPAYTIWKSFFDLKLTPDR